MKLKLDENLGRRAWHADMSWLRCIGLWPIVAGAGALLVYELNHLRLPVNALHEGSYVEFYFVLFVFVATGVAQLLWMRPRNRAWFIQFSLAQLLWVVNLVAIALGAGRFAASYGPLRFSFQANLAEFERLADEALERPYSVGARPPLLIGAYEIVAIEPAESCMVFCLTDRNQWFFYAFARIPGCRSDEEARKAAGNENSLAMRLQGDWFVIFDHYWFIKSGWS